MKRAPVHVVKRKLLGKTFTSWACDTRLQTAEFQDRKDPTRAAIVHRSTKHAGKWQTSFFDDRGASSDFQSATCTEALRELPPGRWRLRGLVPKR